MINALAVALAKEPYSLAQTAREALMITGLNELTKRHYAGCPEYARILDGAWHGSSGASVLADVPYLPVALFKTQRLKSVPADDIRVTLTSSGTTQQIVSKVLLNSENSSIQQRALTNSLTHILGKQRLPMLVIDTQAVFDDPREMSARGAGVLGLMRYGRNHAFALNRDLSPDFDAVRAFLDKNADKPFFLFGFTYMVWVNFYEQFREAGLDLSNGTLIHSGGWKKMADKSVDNSAFRIALKNAFDLKSVYNFYGMVEQIGSIFLEGPGGLLYPPNFADVIVRDPETWRPAPLGQPGIIQVLSLLPHSYPGHSLLTEDIGVIDRIDLGSDGWMGKGIRVLGRVSRSELRGCSDVLGAA